MDIDADATGYYVLAIERATRTGETDRWTMYPIHPEHVAWQPGPLSDQWWAMVQRVACARLDCTVTDLVWWCGYQPWTMERIDTLMERLGLGQRGMHTGATAGT
jgi:hypothetical protein